ncbi:hypothetical protein F4776DRAFT_637338 [Hypoxylon sp. NC0597]|nr:hypothetical protein F4776DRAFT_637338 [Hypoxylon sp. NC0597]
MIGFILFLSSVLLSAIILYDSLWYTDEYCHVSICGTPIHTPKFHSLIQSRTCEGPLGLGGSLFDHERLFVLENGRRIYKTFYQLRT